MAKLSQIPVHPLRTTNAHSQHPLASGAGTLFGAPIGDLGWFATLLMSLAAGFASFFGATFFGIMGVLLYNTAGHHTADFALSYRRIGFPIGVAVTLLAIGYLGSLWIRRQIRHSR